MKTDDTPVDVWSHPDWPANKAMLVSKLDPPGDDIPDGRQPDGAIVVSIDTPEGRIRARGSAVVITF